MTETRQSEKETTKTQRCSEPRVQQMPIAVQTATIPRTRESSRDPGEQHTVTRKTCVLIKKLPSTCNVRCTQARHEKQSSTKTKKKHGQREILESRDIRQVPTKLLIRDVCTCLACPQNFSSIFDHSEETRRCHSYFIRMISQTSSKNDSSCNRVSNARKSVKGLISSKSF